MSRREKLLDLLVARTSATRERLEHESTDELEKILDKSLLAGIRAEVMNSPEVVERLKKVDEINADSQRITQEHVLSYYIFRTSVNGKVAIDNQANRRVILGWPHEDQGEQLSPAWFKKVLSEQPQLVRSLAWQSADVLDPVKRKEAESAQAEADRETFNLFARENGFSEVDANFRLALEVLEPGFSRYALAQAVQSNALQLAPASAEELAKFQREAYEERVDWLQNQASLLELRQAARQESEQGRTQQQRTAQQVKIREDKESSVGYAVLPEANADGVKLDATFFKRLANTDIEKYKQFCSKYGFAAITARLNGVR